MSKIEKNIPLPEDGYGKHLKLFNSMVVGDSIEFDSKEEAINFCSAYYGYKKYHELNGHQIIRRGQRIWVS